MKYLLDTNICIALLAARERALVDRFKQALPADFALCSIVKAELWYCARHSQQVDHNLRVLEKFFLQFESLSFDDRTAEIYGAIRALLATGGTPIGANDLLIASIAQAHDLTVITRNRREFIRVPGLRVEAW